MGLAERPARCYLYSRVVPQRREKGGSSEQISKVITHDMALPVSHHLGSEVSLPDPDRSHRSKGCRRGGSDLRVCRSRGGGAECAERPCPLDRDGSAEGLDLGTDGASQRADVDEDLQAVPAFAKKALLGQSFLVKRVLCGHRRDGRRDDPQVREVPRKARTRDRTTPAGYLTGDSRRNHACPLRGQALVPPMGGRS
jgi:hypothetical protein